jgi:hypothetical protein
MLTRLMATASVLIVGTALATALPAATARADCTVINGVVYCDASDSDQQSGSNGSNNGGNGGGNTGPGAGCQNQGNGVPGQGCTQNPPAAPTVASIDLAWQARGNLAPPPPRIHWSPNPRSYVRLRTGLRIDKADFADLDRTVNAGGQQVTAHATPKRVEWNLVETTIQCPNAGSPDSTACGYTYQRSSASQPGGKYQITATIVWSVNWDCAGNCDPGAGGPLPDILAPATALLPVGEIQTESQPG